MTAPGRVRVLLYAVAPEHDEEAVRRAYHQISARLHGTPGLLGNELLTRADEPRSAVVLSEWESMAAFQEWESGSAHRGSTAPLRPYQDGAGRAAFGIYQVAASYRSDQPA